MQKSDYRSRFAISQSAIKCFVTKGLVKFKKIYIDKQEDDDDDQDKYAYGSLVDTLAFEPALMEKRFFILENEVPIPGEKVKVIADRVYREALEIVENREELNRRGNLPEPLYIPNISEIYDWNDLILKHARAIQFGGTTWSNSRIIDKVYEESNAYFRMLGQAGGRSIITVGDNADAVESVASLQTDINTMAYFVEQENETLLFQQEIFLDYHVGGVPIPLKGALDIIRLRHDVRKARLADLKTTYSQHMFKSIIKSLDYVIQTSFYTFLLREWLKVYEDGKYADYEVEEPINIAIDRDSKIPHIYEYDWEDINIAQNGSDTTSLRGWMNTLEEIAWHIQTGVWDRPKEFYETGKIKLKIFNR